MKRLSLPLVLSLLAHGLILLAIILWGISLRNDEPLGGGGGGSGVTVEIIGGMGPIGQGGREEKSPAVAPAEIPAPPPREAKTKDGMTVKTKPSQKAKPGRPDADGLAVGSPAPGGPGQGSGPIGPGSGAGNGTNAVLAQIHSKIERAKRYPMAARRMNMQGVAEVRFAIASDGQPDGLMLKNSSGYPLLDEEALATIRRAAPYPAYGESLVIGIRFEIGPPPSPP